MFLVNSPHSQSLLPVQEACTSLFSSSIRGQREEELQSQGLQMKTTITES